MMQVSLRRWAQATLRGLGFLLAGGLLTIIAQAAIGPMVGLRIPVWDYVTWSYHYQRLDPTDWQIDGEYIRPLKANGAVQTGIGLVGIGKPGEPQQIMIDTALVLYLGAQRPRPGPCSVTGAVALDRQRVYFCVEDETGQSQWAVADLKTQW